MNFLSERHEYSQISHWDLETKFFNAYYSNNLQLVNEILEIWSNNTMTNNSKFSVLSTLCRKENFISVAEEFYTRHKNSFNPDIGFQVLRQLCSITQPPVICVEWVLSICRVDDVVSVVCTIYRYNLKFNVNDFTQLIVYIIEIFDIDELHIDNDYQLDFDQILYKYKSAITKSSRKN